jgi:hypothetical protein
MLLAKVVARFDLGFSFGKNLLELADDVFQFLTGKLFAEPKDESCYFAHGGGSPGNLAGSFDLPQRKETSPPFALLVKSHRFSPRKSVSSAAENLRSSGPQAVETAALWKGVEKSKSDFPPPFYSAWKTLRKKRSEFPTVPTTSTAGYILFKNFHKEAAPYLIFAGDYGKLSAKSAPSFPQSPKQKHKQSSTPCFSVTEQAHNRGRNP